MISLKKASDSPAVRVAKLALTLFAVCGVMFWSATAAGAAALQGSVRNGTTGRPVAGAEVVLMELQQGMTPVGKTKTNAQGQFRFANHALGNEPMLLEVSYRGVPYYQSIAPSDLTAAIVVYDTTTNPKVIVVGSHVVLLRPNGSMLQVEEDYTVQNQSQPPVAFYANGSTFAFPVPSNAQLGEVSTWTESNVPTRQQTTDMGTDRKSIDWPFRPGKSVVRIAYVIPYPSDAATIRSQSPYAAMHVFVAAPPGVQLLGDGFSPVGSENGFDVYARPSIPADTELAISVSGLPTAATQADGATPSASSGDVSTLPGRHQNVIWFVGAGVALLLAVATAFFWRESSPQANEVDARTAKKRDGATARGNVRRSTVPCDEPDLEQDLDKIKQRLLELKLGHDAGALTEQEYARERQRVERALHEILQD
jgi:Carboxypeptidase regulatory-like domain